MRARLLIVLAVLGAVVVGTFAIPLALATADSRTREFALSRESDLQRFAGLADDYVKSGHVDLLNAEMQTFHDLYGESVAVVSTRGFQPLTVGTSLDDPLVSAAVSRALRNERTSSPQPLNPLSADSMVFAQPVGTGAQVSGAVVLLASTQYARGDIALSWALIAISVAAALAGFGVLAVIVSGWVLRPLEVLSLRIQGLTVDIPFTSVHRPGEDIESEDVWRGPPELRALARSFDSMASAVAHSSEAQRRLVADTAHQLRNPLAALQLRLDTMETLSPPEARPTVTRALEEAARLGRILGDLLALSSAETPRKEGGRMRASCVAAVVAAERVGFWEQAAKAAGLTMIGPPTDGPPSEIRVRNADLDQILDVLLDNECKYAGTGSTVEIRVRATAISGAPAVEIRVEDNGPGVPHDELPLLTQRFFRGTTRNSSGGGDREGTGLGLAIAHALAEANGGQLELSESSSGGLAATLSFPAAEGYEPEEPSKPAGGLD